MKKQTNLIIAIAFLALMFSSCNKTISPGSVGIVVNNWGDNKGVQDVTTTTGFTWYNPMKTDILEYPTSVQTAKWTKDPSEGAPQNEEITFTNKDNMTISTDVSISYSLTASKIPNFYVKFRNDDITAFTHGFLRNITRDAFNETGGSYSIDEIMGNNTKFLAEVRSKVQKEVNAIGVHIEQFGIIGAPRPPQGVIDAINKKLQATQLAIQKENEIRQAEAQAKINIANAEGSAKSLIIQAEADATANKLRQQSLTPLLVQQQFIEKWNGELPVYGTTPQLFKDITK